nr:hypothetical protein [uncultured Desulfobacter sp.]
MVSQLLLKSWDGKNQPKGSLIKALRFFFEIRTYFSGKHIPTFVCFFIKSWGYLEDMKNFNHPKKRKSDLVIQPKISPQQLLKVLSKIFWAGKFSY